MLEKTLKFAKASVDLETFFENKEIDEYDEIDKLIFSLMIDKYMRSFDNMLKEHEEITSKIKDKSNVLFSKKEES